MWALKDAAPTALTCLTSERAEQLAQWGFLGIYIAERPVLCTVSASCPLLHLPPVCEEAQRSQLNEGLFSSWSLLGSVPDIESHWLHQPLSAPGICDISEASLDPEVTRLTVFLLWVHEQ